MDIKEIEIEIERLKELKKTFLPKSSYEARTFLNKIAYDFAPIKFLTSSLKILIIIGIILGGVLGYGYWQGKKSKPVQLIIDEAVEFTIPVPNSDLALYKAKYSTQLVWKNLVTGKVIEKVMVKDIPELAKKLKPIGLILEPVAVGGFGISNAGSGIEGGVGIRYLKYFRWVADTCVTNAGLYPIGISYKLSDNSAIGLSVGTGFKKGERGFFERWLMKFTMKF